jgi:hypothetical protein
MKNYIVEHIRDKKRNPYATLVGYYHNGNVFIGDAKCNKKFDTFQKSKGVEIALNRAMKYINISNNSIIYSDWNELIDDEVIKFGKRCKKYFKTNQIFYNPRFEFIDSSVILIFIIETD